MKTKRRTLAVKKIEGAIHEEKEAVKDYRKDARKVDTRTAKLFRHIAKEESGHKRELKKRLSSVVKG